MLPHPARRPHDQVEGEGRELCAACRPTGLRFGAPAAAGGAYSRPCRRPAGAAQTLYWDGGTVNGGNPAPNANGGTGTWNNTLTNWDTAATGGADSAWVNGADAAFTGTAGTVTVDPAGVAAHSLVFANGGWLVNGGTITMTGASPSITASFQDAGTINSVIAGTNGLTTGGNGVVVLNGTNTFTGGLTVNGALRLGGVNSANGANNVVRVTGGNSLLVNYQHRVRGRHGRVATGARKRVQSRDCRAV